MSTCSSGGCRIQVCTGHHKRRRSLAMQWGCNGIGSTDCSHNDKVEEEDGKGGASVGQSCSTFVSRVGRGGFGTLRLYAVDVWRCCNAEGVDEERDEVARDMDRGEE